MEMILKSGEGVRRREEMEKGSIWGEEMTW